MKVVRDLFTEDFPSWSCRASKAWDTIDGYVRHVAPDLADRLRKHVGLNDVFTEQRIDEQITKALDRKVWLPSGGYLVIDRTEAMTVIDVNTGKFTGSGGNLEETVTRNNLEAAEEIVRQLRLRDIGGIIVIDFIDMVLESNRDLVLRRLTECLGRDRTRHQVAEVTSLGLVQMTRKRVGTGLLEAFSSTCEHCRGGASSVTTERDHPQPRQRRSLRPATAATATATTASSRRRRRSRPRSPAASATATGTATRSSRPRRSWKPPRPPLSRPRWPRPSRRRRGRVDSGGDRRGRGGCGRVDLGRGRRRAGSGREPAAAESADAEPADAEPVAAEPAAAEEAAPAVAAAAVTGQSGVSVPYEVPSSRPSPRPTATTRPSPAAEPEPVVSATRRRVRRAASRPAGPPASTVTQD
ncbi:hypothetical protein GCM10018954_070210 [Kutzneria kofuensis]